MLSSETCMLASQQLLMDKRNHFEHDNISQSKNPIDIEKCHVTRSFSQKIDTHSKYISICDKLQSNASSYMESLSHSKVIDSRYDSIVHPLLSIACQCLGVALSVMETIFSTIQNMCISLCMAHGDSSSFYGGTLMEGLPFQGVYQGNRAGPAIWLATC